MVADWSNLQPDLLELIAKRLQIEDILRMKANCRRWRSVIKERAIFINTTLVHNKTQLPWLFFPGTYFEPQVCRFYSLTDNTMSRIRMPETVTGPGICGSSSYGWLVIRGDYPSMFLLNPLTRKCITLPPFDPVRGVDKVILGNPSSSLDDNKEQNYKDWVAIAMYRVEDIYSHYRTLAFAKPGDLEWTSIGLEWIGNGDYPHYEDLVIWKEKLYVIDHYKRFWSTKIMDTSDHTSSNTCPKLEILNLGDKPVYYNCKTRNHLVVSSSGDDLLLVCRVLNVYDNYRTIIIFVYKLETEGTVWKWKKIETIGNETIFLSFHQSICLPASAEREANCIYYADEHMESIVQNDNLRVFNITSYQFRSIPGSPKASWRPPLWFTPSLC